MGPDHSYRGAGLVRDHSESAHNVFVVFIAGAIGLFLLGWDEEADVKFGGRWACYIWYRQR